MPIDRLIGENYGKLHISEVFAEKLKGVIK